MSDPDISCFPRVENTKSITKWLRSARELRFQKFEDKEEEEEEEEEEEDKVEEEEEVERNEGKEVVGDGVQFSLILLHVSSTT